MKVGPYEVVGTLGRGGMGQVHEAVSPRGETVAIKVLHRLDPGTRARFERERRLLGSLGEVEGFVPILDAGEVAGEPYLVMPLLPGGTLRERLARGTIPVEEALGVARALARAMARAHERGIVHRDLKPENVLFTAEGAPGSGPARPLIADLGLAKHFRRDLPGASQSRSFSQAGEMRGTLGYMPPEQMKDARSVGPQADVFALGAILFECLSGVAPFAGDTVAETLARLDQGPARSVRDLRADVPEWLARVVARALARNLHERYRDALELERALAPGAAPRRVRWLVAGAAAFALAAGGAGLALGPARGTPAPGPPPVAPPAPTPAPSPVAPPTPAPPPGAQASPLLDEDLRFACRGFLESPHLRLVRSIGRTDGKVLDGIGAIAFFPDGKRLATGGSGMDPTAKVWDAGTRRELLTLVGNAFALRDVAVSGDGRRVVTLEEQGKLCVFAIPGEAGSPREIAPERVVPVGAPVSAFALFQDGRRALVATREPIGVTVLDLESGTKLQGFEGSDKVEAKSLALSSDERAAVGAGVDGSIRFWQVESGRVRETTNLPRALSATFARRSLMALVVTEAGTLEELDLDKPRNRERPLPGPVVRLAVAASGREVVLEGSGGLTWWDGKSPGGRINVGPCTAIAVSPAGDLVFGAREGALHAWTLPSGERLAEPDAGHGGRIVTVGFSPDGKRLLSLGTDGSVRTSEVATGKQLFGVTEPGTPAGAALVGDGVAIAAADRIREVTPAVMTMLGARKPRAGRITAFVLSPGQESYALGTEGGDVLLLDRASRSDEPRWRAHLGDEEVAALAFDAQGNRLLAGGGKGQLALLDAATGQSIRSFDNPRDVAVTCVAFVPGGTGALSASRDGFMRLWDTETTGPKALFRHARDVHALAVSPDGKLAASGSSDLTLRLWDLERRDQLDSLDMSCGPDFPTALAFSPDGKSLVAGTRRGVVLELEVR